MQFVCQCETKLGILRAGVVPPSLPGCTQQHLMKLITQAAELGVSVHMPSDLQ
jgi:hypothetical protein